MQKIIAFVGISGVGKTKFLNNVANLFDFQHLTAGTLITQALKAKSRQRDELRLEDVNANQQLLVEGFRAAKDFSRPLVILDGHTVIHQSYNLIKIEDTVFAALGINAIVHLEAAPSQIYVNRQGDASRDRPCLSVEELAYHQRQSLTRAKEVAQALSIPLKQVEYGEKNAFISFASSLMSA